MKDSLMRKEPTRILVFMSEILSAKTLAPIVSELRSDLSYSVQVISDGFCKEFIDSLDLDVEFILDDFEDRTERLLLEASLVLMGKSYEQPSEYTILRQAEHIGVPVLLALPDMGFDIVKAKLKGLGGNCPTSLGFPLLLLADERTRASLLDCGTPEARLVELGNPYFDAHYEALLTDSADWNQLGIGYFSTPFELDFKRGILPANYRQADLIADIRRVCTSLDQPLKAKRHPQVDPELFDELEVFEGTPLEMIRSIRIAVGSYSTTLLEAFSAGIPAISYQPWDENIRDDVFKDRIPIVKSIEELKEAIQVALISAPNRCGPIPITFNPGTSLNMAVKFIRACSSDAECGNYGAIAAAI